MNGYALLPYRMEDHQFGDTSGAWQFESITRSQSHNTTLKIKAHIPDPRRRAAADSFFTSFEAG